MLIAPLHIICIFYYFTFQHIRAEFLAPCQLRPERKAFEIISIFNCSVYVAVIPESKRDNESYTSNMKHQYEAWSPTFSWMKNTGGLRHTTFDASCIFGSPGKSENVKHQITAGEPWEDAMDWLYLANFCIGKHGMGGCFPEKCQELKALKGSLRYTEISKCHNM